MRALHIGKYYPPFAGGIESFMADLLPALAAEGVNVAALVHHERPDWRGLEPHPDDPIPIFRAPCYGRLLYAPISPAFPWWLNRIIREFRPELLHLHLPNTSAFAALLLPAARALPWIIHWHADVVASSIDRRLALAYRFYRPFEQRLLATSRAIVVTSPDYLEASAALEFWRSKCVAIPLGLDPTRIPEPALSDRAQAEALWGVGPAQRILAIGRLTYYKGHQTLIRAAPLLPHSRIIIVGGGEQQDALSASIQRSSLDERVRLIGHQPAALRDALLATCDLVCLPSLERTEAFGMVLLEAMRFAKPVVASAIPGSGVGWVVRRADHGLLAPPNDASALAAAIDVLANDPRRAQQLGQHGQAALAREFAIDAVAQGLRALYAQTLNGL